MQGINELTNSRVVERGNVLGTTHNIVENASRDVRRGRESDSDSVDRTASVIFHLHVFWTFLCLEIVENGHKICSAISMRGTSGYISIPLRISNC